MAKKMVSVFLFVLLAALMASCGSDPSGSDCQVVANPDWSNNLKVINNLDTGVEWKISKYPFGADMKPGECVIMGVSEGSYTVDLTQCQIGDAACISMFGPTITENFTVSGGQTHTIDVTSGMF